MNKPISLDDKYTATEGHAFMTGTQALVRLPMTQIRRDRAAGLDTGAFISGYRGSPVGGYDQQLWVAGKFLGEYDITFQPGVNEELAATAVWGTQQLEVSDGANKDGVMGIWYGKGPGVDRCGDVFKHANASGTSKHGGVLCVAGDDHTAKSSTIPHQSDHAFMAASMPFLYPSSIHEFLELGLFAIAMSRFSGCWTGMKVISDTIETTAAVDLASEQRVFQVPNSYAVPGEGLNFRWPDERLPQDERLQNHKVFAALAFARANGIDQVTLSSPNARIGIAASGKAYEDVSQALEELGIGQAEANAIGLSVMKVRMPWPLETEGMLSFATGLDELIVVEERREVIETQLRDRLYALPDGQRPRIIGKSDEHGAPVFPVADSLDAGKVALALARRFMAFDFDESLKTKLQARMAFFEARYESAKNHETPVLRTPYFCSGCPHNTSTRVPEGSKAMAGIGCHFMSLWMDRNTETFTQMGGEGTSWIGMAPFTDEQHRFVNLGDGTYFHSGSMAIRASVAAKVNVTYKVLYNDAVAMTGGQKHDGELSPVQIAHQMFNEGVKPIYLISDTPEAYSQSELPKGTTIKHRDYLDEVQRELREIKGTSGIVYVQTCAAEKRRRRKRGLMEDPPKRLFINPEVCEGCGDCSEQSNCVSIEPLETAMGRKRQINQSSCNKDYSCVKGFCPSFVTIHGGEPKRSSGVGEADVSGLPEPKVQVLGDTAYNIAVTGVGGTGVLTIGALLGMAAHIEGNASIVLDMAGLAQKGGAVLSHIRLARSSDMVGAPKIVSGGGDLLLAADDVVAAGDETAVLCDPERTSAIVNTMVTPVANFVKVRDFDFKAHAVEATIRRMVRSDDHFHNFGELAEALVGDRIATNIMMLGYASQAGLLPVSFAALEQAVELNGVAVKPNLKAFRWGRLLAHDPAAVLAMVQPASKLSEVPDTLDALIEHRKAHLTGYQGKQLAKRFEKRVRHVADAIAAKGFDETLAKSFARNYAKLLSYKDEYEVARQLTSGAFHDKLSSQFEGDFKIAFNLAPPILPGKAPGGRPKKREFGAWILPVMRFLAKGKRLRATPFDPFGYTAERKMERGLIKEYEALIEQILPDITADNIEITEQLFDLPNNIRGYGPVKETAVAKAQEMRKELLAAFANPTPGSLAAQ